MDSTGRPLGLLAGRGYEEVRLPLDEGDILFFYTDGMVEAENERGEFLGADRLEAALAVEPRSDVDSVLVHVEKHRPRVPRQGRAVRRRDHDGAAVRAERNAGGSRLTDHATPPVSCVSILPPLVTLTRGGCDGEVRFPLRVGHEEGRDPEEEDQVVGTRPCQTCLTPLSLSRAHAAQPDRHAADVVGPGHARWSRHQRHHRLPPPPGGRGLRPDHRRTRVRAPARAPLGHADRRPRRRRDRRPWPSRAGDRARGRRRLPPDLARRVANVVAGHGRPARSRRPPSGTRTNRKATSRKPWPGRCSPR